jgi:hypothetical protein
LVEPLAAAQKAYSLLQCFREHGGHHVHIQHVSLKPTFTTQSHILKASRSCTSIIPTPFAKRICSNC